MYGKLLKTSTPTDLICVIMECITTACMDVLWEREFIENFKLIRRIKQGGPISLYIFVLCIERPRHRIRNALRTEDWKRIQLAVVSPSYTCSLPMIFLF